MRSSRVPLFCALLLCVSCDGDLGVDAGTSPDTGIADAGSDAAAPCARDSECDDDLYCNGDERCLDTVCVPGTPPCAAAACDEAMDICSCAGDADVDGDGHDSTACGGDDCDDDDVNRFAGNGEVCDAEGHDEDCDDSTVGDRDVDGDGFIDAACCNGTTCGRDCDDRFRGVNPDEMEQCNAFDDNCDGRVDEPISFCPVGMCVASRCESVSWERVVDVPDREDFLLGLVTDPAGNVYIGVRMDDALDLDGDGTDELPGVHLVSYTAEGRVRWTVPTPEATGKFGLSLAGGGTGLVLPRPGGLLFRDTSDGSASTSVDISTFGRWDRIQIFRTIRVGDELIVAARPCVEPGGAACPGESAILLIRYSADGVERARRLIDVPGATLQITAASSGASRTHFALVALSDVPVDWGEGVVPAGSYVLVLGSDLATRTVIAPSTNSGVSAVDVDEGGAVMVAGSFVNVWTPSWESTTYTARGEDAYAALLDSSGAHRWTRVHSGPADDGFDDVFYDPRGNYFITGRFSGEMDVAPRGRIGSPAATDQIVLLLLGESDGDRFVPDVRTLAGDGSISRASVDPFGALVAAGEFPTNIFLPSGAEYTTGRANGIFLFRIADF